jgi:hypothetical protein
MVRRHHPDSGPGQRRVGAHLSSQTQKNHEGTAKREEVGVGDGPEATHILTLHVTSSAGQHRRKYLTIVVGSGVREQLPLAASAVRISVRHVIGPKCPKNGWQKRGARSGFRTRVLDSLRRVCCRGRRTSRNDRSGQLWAPLSESDKLGAAGRMR